MLGISWWNCCCLSVGFEFMQPCANRNSLTSKIPTLQGRLSPLQLFCKIPYSTMNSLSRTQCVLRTVRSLKSPKLHARCFSTSKDRVIIDVDSKTGLATLAMNSPPVNGLDSEMLRSCTTAIKFVEKERDVRGAIVKSNFDGKVFSAGLNILDMFQKDEAHLLDFWTCVQDWFIAWYGCSKPVVALINGHAPAGGCALAMCCDYRLMQSDGGKTIGLNETLLGISAPFFFADAMKKTIGSRHTERALFLGKLFTADEAKDVGLVDVVGPLDQITPAATAELAKLAAIPPGAYATTKMTLRRDVIEKLIAVKREDAQNFATYVSHPKVQEAIGKYLQSLKSRKN